MKSSVPISLLLLAGLSYIPYAAAFTVEVMPSENLCFFEELKKGERLLVGFQVQDGPEYEVDFEVNFQCDIRLTVSR